MSLSVRSVFVSKYCLTWRAAAFALKKKREPFAIILQRPNSLSCCWDICIRQSFPSFSYAPLLAQEIWSYCEFLALILLDFLPNGNNLRFRFLVSSSKDDESVEMLSSHCWYCWWNVAGSLDPLSTRDVVAGRGEKGPMDSRRLADWELVRGEL